MHSSVTGLIASILILYLPMRRYPGLFLSLIVLASVLGGFFVSPKFLGEKFRPWRLGLDLVGGSHLVFNVDLSQVKEGDWTSVLDGLRDVIERRVNLYGVSEPQVFIAKAAGQPQLIVQLAGIHDVDEAIKIIGDTPRLDFREVIQNGTTTDFAATDVTGRFITGARLDFDPTTRAPQVSFSFTSEGAMRFEKLTEKNVGKSLAIFLDDVPIEIATVNGKISGGEAVITGKFTTDQAKDLVSRFNAGALPAPVSVVDRLTVSPTLGADSLRRAVFAGVIGTLLVMLFMLIYYRLYGAFASVALLIYIVLTLSIFKLVPITLTLAGFAGFIITIGMAVDANILIFERMKEETKKGISRAMAIEEGFRRAWPSIRDSNMSTIITAIILYSFTSSFVKGFALTLLIGTLISMFSAITTTRLLLFTFLKHR